MFFLPSSRFKLVRIYHEDPTGSTIFSNSKQSNLFRFLTLLFYSFLFNKANWVPFAFTSVKKPYWSWVYNNKYRIMQWDILRRYNYKFFKLLRMSSYKKSLLEYKKLKYFYFTLRDYQFRKFALKGLPLYTRFKAHFLSFLEFRLLTLCVRLGFYDTHIRGRQEINHFGIFVDNKRVYYSNYVVKVGSTFLLKPFVGFNNFKIGLDSFRKPRFTRVRKMLKSWIPRKILSLRARVRQFTWRTRHKQSYNYSVSPIRKSVVRSNKIDSTVRILGGGISNKFAFSLYQNWFKIFEFSVFSIKKRRRSRQYRRPFFKNRDDFLWRQEKKKKNPLIYENRYEDRLIDRRIVNVKNFLVPRKLFFERSVYPIFFRNSPFFSSTFRRKNVIQWRRKVFHLRPKPYMLISWALKKIYLIGAPRLQDVTFPFLADPTLAFGFINSR